MKPTKTLIIQIKWGGLGDHLFYSHIPRIAKETGAYEKVYISNYSEFRHPDYRKIVWEYNPYIDGFTDLPGVCYEQIPALDKQENLLDKVMLMLDIDDGKRFHEPEIYYQPTIKEEWKNISVYDPNYVAYVGEFSSADLNNWVHKNKVSLDCQMKIRERNKSLPKPNNYINTPTLEEFCSLIVSCKQLYCLASGTATLAAALGKSATVFYGRGQGEVFHHSPLHKFVLIKEPFIKQCFINLINMKIHTNQIKKYVPKFITSIYSLLKKYCISLINPDAANYKISYAQSGEDLIVKFIFDRIGIEKPTYMDIGAFHPYTISNTALFYHAGCKGVHIEPNDAQFKLFEKHRKNATNLNCGIGLTKGEADYYMMSDPALNTFSSTEAKLYEEQGCKIIATLKKKITTLQQVVQEHCNGVYPQFLSIDSEGLDELIVQSIDFNNIPPIVICVESISYSNTGQGIKNNNIRDFLSTKNYMLYADTNINSIFVRKDKWIK